MTECHLTAVDALIGIHVIRVNLIHAHSMINSCRGFSLIGIDYLNVYRLIDDTQSRVTFPLSLAGGEKVNQSIHQIDMHVGEGYSAACDVISAVPVRLATSRLVTTVIHLIDYHPTLAVNTLL